MDTAPQPGWTAIPNELLEHMADLGNAELRVLLAVYRQTAGYQRATDMISYRQFESMTGLARQHIKTALDGLIAKNMLTREPAKQGSYVYQLVTLGNQLPAATGNPRLPELVTLSYQSDPELVTLGNQTGNPRLPELVTLGNRQKKEKETLKETRESTPLTPIRSGEPTALSIYQDVTGEQTPNQAQRALIGTVQALDVWRATCEEFMLNGWKVQRIPNLIDNYTRRLAERKVTQAKRNGHDSGGPNGVAVPHDYSQELSPYSDEYRARLRAGSGK